MRYVRMLSAVVAVGGAAPFPMLARAQESPPVYGQPPPGPPQPHADDAYPQQGVPQQGYPPLGVPPQGYPQQGYPPQGVPPQGYPQPNYQQPAYLQLRPPPVHLEERPRYNLVVSGSLVFGIPWLVSATIGYFAYEGYFAVPVVGPLIEISRCSGCTTATPDGRVAVLFLSLDSLTQAAGVALILVGATTTHKVPVANQLSLVPAPVRGGGGLALSGRF